MWCIHPGCRRLEAGATAHGPCATFERDPRTFHGALRLEDEDLTANLRGNIGLTDINPLKRTSLDHPKRTS